MWAIGLIGMAESAFQPFLLDSFRRILAPVEKNRDSDRAYKNNEMQGET